MESPLPIYVLGWKLCAIFDIGVMKAFCEMLIQCTIFVEYNTWYILTFAETSFHGYFLYLHIFHKNQKNLENFSSCLCHAVDEVTNESN